MKRLFEKHSNSDLRLGATINPFSTFDRKSYFYPDSPRNFQDHPIWKSHCYWSSVTVELEGEMKTFEIDHAHLEDDAGCLNISPILPASITNRAVRSFGRNCLPNRVCVQRSVRLCQSGKGYFPIHRSFWLQYGTEVFTFWCQYLCSS